MNLTFNTTAKLWLQIYDDLRCLIRDEIDAAQDASKEVSPQLNYPNLYFSENKNSFFARQNKKIR